MIEVKITKKTETCVFVFWEENDAFGNLKIEYTNDGNYKIDAEYIGMDRLLTILKNIR